MAAYTFPSGFLWGCAAASYQIEGATSEDGRGESIWDRFCKRPGAVRHGQSGAMACDHYHRWREDLDLIRDLGFGAYRFSIAWPRIFPQGTGAPNERGIAFYDRLVDGMLERGIEPMCTLYHWDLPQALEDRGGWRVRETADAFARYAETMARRLGDRVAMWSTFNEMNCLIDLGYRDGIHAPGAREDRKTWRQVAHHVLLAHGLGVQALRAAAPRPVRAGLVHNPVVFQPFYENSGHIDFAREQFIHHNSWMMDPLVHGRYPEARWREAGADVPDVQDGDLATIAQRLDFWGLNFYGVSQVAHAQWGLRPWEKHHPRTGIGWAVTPDVLYWAVRTACETYNLPEVYITENGCAQPDDINADGRVEDYARIDYLTGALRGLHRAAAEGFPVKGYFVWSILDNFEWHQGYSQRFGITFVNYETQQRTPKASALWLREVMRNNGL